jgi:protocatechuate 3,4-dioxygenase beta subunit
MKLGFDRLLTRRAVGGALAAGAAFLFAPVRGLAAACRALVAADAGPFYPVEPIPDTEDLLGGAIEPGSVTILYFVGRVLGDECHPIGGAEVEIWQCDHGGQYKHPRAPKTKPLEPGFAYFAKCRSGRDGAFRFRTMRPAPYEVFGIRRAPHIHLRVGAEGRPLLTTEVYFAGLLDDELRLRDRVFQSRGARRGELVAVLRPAQEERHRLAAEPEPGALVCSHDFSLDPLTGGAALDKDDTERRTS